MSNIRLIRQKPPGEAPTELRSGVVFALPFAIDIFPEPYTYPLPDSTELQLFNIEKESEVIQKEMNIRMRGIHFDLPKISGSISLDPDTQGFVSLTGAMLFLNRYLDVADMGSTEILDICIPYVNAALDLYSLITRQFRIRKISNGDILTFQVFDYLPSDKSNSRTLSIAWVFPASRLTSRKPISEETLKLLGESHKYFTELDKNYMIAYTLYAEAMRAFESDDFRLAAIHGITSLEAALPHVTVHGPVGRIDGLRV